MKLIKIMSSSIVATLLMVGCGSSGGGSTPDAESGTDNIPSSNNSTQATNLKFNVKGASSLQANEDVVESTGDRSANGLFTYRVVNNNSRDSVTKGTNLMAVDANGNASLALTSELPIKVMYSAVNPKTGLVYLALDNGWYGDNGGVDLQKAIANENCAFYEVNPENNNYKCVSTGKFLQNYNDDYMKTISGNQKPVQFDDEGNVYFLATDFQRDDNSWCDNGRGDSKETCEADNGRWNTEYWINGSNWNPRLYKYTSSTSELKAITQDNENVEFFAALSTGDVIYQSQSTTGTWSSKLMMKKANSDSVINLTGDTWGVDFFTIDTRNTVLFGQNSWNGSGEDGIRIVQPGSVGVKKTTLNTSKFGQNSGNGSWQNPKPRRIIVADDGKIYGVFEGGKDSYNTDGSWKKWEQTLNVYQMLPFDPIPKAQLNLGDNDWWTWMGDTPFQISKGFLYYKETKENITVSGESLGSGDFIKIVNLDTRETSTILEPVTVDDKRYDVYKWSLSGDKLYFSALNKNENVVVTATIDTVKVKQGLDVSQYLEIKNTASASGAVSQIQDIEVLKPAEPEVDTGSAPSIVTNGISMNPENEYSISVEFSKYMNTNSIMDNLKLISSNTTEGANSDGIISYIPVWVYKTMHMIPDLSAQTLGDSVSVGLTKGNTYTLDFESGIQDKFGWDLSATNFDTNVTMAPSTGWYVGSSDSVDTSISEGNVIKFAGLSDISHWNPQTYLLNDINSTTNFRVDFSAKNFGYNLGQLVLWDTNSTDTNYYNHMDLSIELSSWLNINYKDLNNNSQWDGQDVQTIANGNWKVYRLDVYANTVKFSVSEDGSTFTEVLSKTDLKSRTTNHKLLYRVTDKVAMDNLVISTLNNDGSVISEGDILNKDFTGFNVSNDTEPTFNVEDNSTGLSDWTWY